MAPETIIIVSGIVAFLVTWFAVPSVVSVSRKKKLFDEPSRRKSHVQSIPTIGGIAIFMGVVVAGGIFVNHWQVPSLQYIIVACLIVFVLGLKDDMVNIRPTTKLLGQIAAALVLIVPGMAGMTGGEDHAIYFTSLHGFMGIYHLEPFTSLVLTIFVIIVVINSFNLVDGVDGLSSSLGVLISAFFGIWFYISGNVQYSILSATTIGALLGFFFYNVFGRKNKIFMGDTGSLLVGLLMAIQVILFNQKNIGHTSAFHIDAAPGVSFAVMIIPLFDTMRVFIIRLLRHRSPFAADKNHLHHLLLKLGYSHIQTTMFIVLINCCFIVLSLLLQPLGIMNIVLVSIAFATVGSLLLERHVRRQHKA